MLNDFCPPPVYVCLLGCGICDFRSWPIVQACLCKLMQPCRRWQEQRDCSLTKPAPSPQACVPAEQESQGPVASSLNALLPGSEPRQVCTAPGEPGAEAVQGRKEGALLLAHLYYGGLVADACHAAEVVVYEWCMLTDVAAAKI